MLEEAMVNGVMDEMANDMITVETAAPCVVEPARGRGRIHKKSFVGGLLIGAGATILVGTLLGWRRAKKTEQAKTDVDRAAEKARAEMAGSNEQQTDFAEVDVDEK